MEIRPPNAIVIFCDGACTGNPGPGGWGSIIVTPDDQVVELGGPEKATTNNRMEITAAMRALQWVEKLEYPVILFTDSTYVIRGITQWIWGWQKKDWLSSSDKPVANADLWKEFSRTVRARKDFGPIEWRHVRGHTGVEGNERCDEIAVSFTKGKRPKLFRGPLHDYHIDLSAIPPLTELPEMKDHGSAKKKTPAYSYLSYVNGVLNRHETWADCERVVKGRPGAKFKKAASAEDEIAIVKSWGLDPARLTKVKA